MKKTYSTAIWGTVGALVVAGAISNAVGGGNDSDAESSSLSDTTSIVTTTENTTSSISTSIDESVVSETVITTEKATTTAPKETQQIKMKFVLNTDSMKAHTEHCYMVDKINDENKSEFEGTSEELKEKGYSPCGKCRPW